MQFAPDFVMNEEMHFILFKTASEDIQPTTTVDGRLRNIPMNFILTCKYTFEMKTARKSDRICSLEMKASLFYVSI